MSVHNSLGDLKLDQTVFFLCDMQERFRPAIKFFSDIVEVAKRLYPKGLGSTIEELNVSNAVCVIPKTKFSMVLPEVETHLKNLCGGKVKHIILFGVETHVCIQQTVIDLLARGFEVHVMADACSSRSQMDRMFALERFRHIGATVTTSEAVLLQLVGDKDHPKFKEIQAIIKISAPESGLVSSL
ncbi:isochorismatase domain-containing protein 1-like isoform X2 [Pomacea canaliculata]|uniref:isochorismatase domain-containing protein 1-like isoform X2 n=1 Tax=Pomacea canaliculata TaxID=400727 RepID=UPI000D735CDA|nr:isochorismatase domain-containing protein 1-like isoform X2 [Pomacea canaliculata]